MFGADPEEAIRRYYEHRPQPKVSDDEDEQIVSKVVGKDRLTAQLLSEFPKTLRGVLEIDESTYLAMMQDSFDRDGVRII